MWFYGNEGSMYPRLWWVVDNLGQGALSNWEGAWVKRFQSTLVSLLRAQGLIQNVCHCSSTDGGKHVLYIIPSAVEDHYIFYYEGKVHRHHFRMAKLLGESHCCEMGQGLLGWKGPCCCWGSSCKKDEYRKRSLSIKCSLHHSCSQCAFFRRRRP